MRKMFTSEGYEAALSMSIGEQFPCIADLVLLALGLLSLSLEVGRDAFFEGGIFLAGLGEAVLHVGSDLGVVVGEAVGLVDVVNCVVELFVLEVAEGEDVAALVGLIDVLPLLGADGDDLFVVEEHKLVVGRGRVVGEDSGYVEAVEF